MDYNQFLIKRFEHWELYLHKNQYPYIGRCYAAAIREDANLVTEMQEKEREELFADIIPKWHRSVQQLYGDSRPNIAIFGNEWPHLHAHLIPRFEGTRNFYGIDFTDPNPKGNYSPYPKKELPLETLLTIKANIKELV